MKRHLGVLFSYFYLFGAAVLIVTEIYFYPEVNNFGIVNRFGLPSLSEQPYRIIVAVVSLFIIYGYSCLRLKKRGLSFMIIYSFGFWLVSYFLLLRNTYQTGAHVFKN